MGGFYGTGIEIWAEFGQVGFIEKNILANYEQSHYREVPWGEVFMEQELRFGLDLGQMANFSAFIASKSLDL